MLNPGRFDTLLNTLGAWLLALLWVLPLLYAVWSAIHPTEFSARFELLAPLTLDNFSAAWAAAPASRIERSRAGPAIPAGRELPHRTGAADPISTASHLDMVREEGGWRERGVG